MLAGPFTHAYHNQPRCDGPGNYGRTSVNRFHILDRIPFTKDFKFDMELWHWNEKCKVNMAVSRLLVRPPGATDTLQADRSALTRWCGPCRSVWCRGCRGRSKAKA